MFASSASSRSTFALVLLAGLIGWPAASLAQVARVIDSKGTSIVERTGQAPRILGANEKLDERDTISVARDSWTILEFTDQTRITLRPNTVFRIDAYSAGAPESALMGLVKGGFRAVTGWIGKRNPRSMRVHTALATIGIRGTEFDARLCEGDCAQEELRDRQQPRHQESAGRIADLRGRVFAQGRYGASRELVRGSTVSVGDRIVTANDAWAAIVFRDDTRLGLLPASRLVLLDFRYETGSPAQDAFSARISYGAVRVSTGTIAKRSPDSFVLRTRLGNLSPRGTTFDATCTGQCAEGGMPPFERMADGTWVTLEGGQRVFFRSEPPNHRIVQEPPSSPPVLLVTQPDGTTLRLEPNSPGVQSLSGNAATLNIAGGGRIELPRYSDERQLTFAGINAPLSPQGGPGPAAGTVQVQQDPSGATTLYDPGSGQTLIVPPDHAVVPNPNGPGYIVGSLSPPYSSTPVPEIFNGLLRVAPDGQLYVVGSDNMMTFLDPTRAPYRSDGSGTLWIRLAGSDPLMPEIPLRSEPPNHTIWIENGEPVLVITHEGATFRLGRDHPAVASLTESGVTLRLPGNGELQLPRYSDQRQIVLTHPPPSTRESVLRLSPGQSGGGVTIAQLPDGGLRVGDLVLPPGHFIAYSPFLGAYFITDDSFFLTPFDPSTSDPSTAWRWQESASLNLLPPSGVNGLSRDSANNVYALGSDGMPVLVSMPGSFSPEEYAYLTWDPVTGSWKGTLHALSGVRHPKSGLTVSVLSESVQVSDYYVQRLIPSGETVNVASTDSPFTTGGGPIRDIVLPGTLSTLQFKKDRDGESALPGLYAWVRDGAITLQKNLQTVEVPAGSAAVATEKDVKLLDAVPNFMRFDPTPVPTLPVNAGPDAFRLPDGALSNMCTVR